jgi:hypothetical protein
MLHARIASGFDLEILLGEACFAALIRAGLAALLGNDGTIDLAAHGAVAPDHRYLSLLVRDLEVHGGGQHGDLSVKLRAGLGPSPFEAKTGTRVAAIAVDPTPHRPTLTTAAAAKKKKTPLRPSSRPMPIPQGPPAPTNTSSPPAGPPLPVMTLTLPLRLNASGSTIVVTPGTMAHERAVFAGWLSGHLGPIFGLAAVAALDAAIVQLRFELPAPGRARVVWTWLAGDAETQPALALLVNLDLDLRAHNGAERPSAAARGEVAKVRNHLPPGVAVRVAVPAVGFSRLQRAAQWAAPASIGNGDTGTVYIQKLELLLRPSSPGYIDVRIQIEVEIPGLNGKIAYQVPVIPRVVGNQLRWDVGTVARDTDLAADIGLGIYNTFVGLANLYGADYAWGGAVLAGHGDALGRKLAEALTPLAAALPARIDVPLAQGRSLSFNLQPTAVAVDAQGASFHLLVAR